MKKSFINSMQRYNIYFVYTIVADILPTKMLRYAQVCMILPTYTPAYTRIMVHPYPLPPESQRGHIVITAYARYILA